MLRRMALLVASATLLVVMTASLAWAQGEGTANPCSPGEFPAIDPDTGLPICVEAQDKSLLPKSGGVPPGSLLMPAAALLVGGGVLGYAVLRRR